MSKFPPCALVRSYVLNNLEKGPARVADLIRRGEAEFGFSHGEIESAAKHFAVVTQVKKGEIYWMRPANLFAIWWGLGRDPDESAIEGAKMSEPDIAAISHGLSD